MNLYCGFGFIILGIILAIVYRENSKIGKEVFKICMQQSIINEFKKLNLSGYDFMHYLATNNNDIIIIQDKKNEYGAYVRGNKVFLGNCFSKQMTLETYRDCLHEYCHILQGSKVKSDFITNIIMFALISVLFTNKLIFLVLREIANKNYIIFSHNCITIIAVVTITLCIVNMYKKILIEKEAIQFAANKSRFYNHRLRFNRDTSKIVCDYLMNQAYYIIKWYNAQNISTYLFFIGMILIFV